MYKSFNSVDRAVGERLRELRLSHNFDRQAFAQKLNISPSTLDELEWGRERLSASMLWHVCEIFEIKPVGFYDGVRRPPQERGDTTFHDMQEPYEA